MQSIRTLENQLGQFFEYKQLPPGQVDLSDKLFQVAGGARSEEVRDYWKIFCTDKSKAEPINWSAHKFRHLLGELVSFIHTVVLPLECVGHHEPASMPYMTKHIPEPTRRKIAKLAGPLMQAILDFTKAMIKLVELDGEKIEALQ